MARTAIPFLLGIALLAGACAASPPENDFTAYDSASRAKSIRQAVDDNDASAVRHIVEQLDCDDAVIRLLAINALQELTGETNGYHYDDPPSLRNSAIARWVAYVNRTYPESTRADG